MGKGFCTSPGGRGLPCYWSSSNTYSDCEFACSDLPDCVAFDVLVNTNCHLRFSSLRSLLATPKPNGYKIWKDGSCGNDCGGTIVGGGQPNGRCMVKIGEDYTFDIQFRIIKS